MNKVNTMAFTDHLFEFPPCIGESEQKTEGFCFVLLFALSVAQDVQEGESPSILQKLHQVLITDNSKTTTHSKEKC